MDVIKYFSDRICEELNDAHEYAKNEFTLKAMDTSWAKTFIEMANAELVHATKLYQMFDQFYQIMTKSVAEIPESMEEARDSIIEVYTTKYPTVKGIIDLYNKS